MKKEQKAQMKIFSIQDLKQTRHVNLCKNNDFVIKKDLIAGQNV